MKFKPSHQQEKIFEWFSNPDTSRNLVIRARAGTGKSTTVLEGITLAPERSILMAAFNTRIADHLKAEISNPFARARTLNSLGYEYVRRFWPHVDMVNTKMRETPRVNLHAAKVAGVQAPQDMLVLIAKLATKGKEMAPLAENPGDLQDLAYEFDCVPDEEWEEFGWDVSYICEKAFEVMELATHPDPKIDFADQIYLPIRNKWIRGRFDLIVVDEAQDMNVSQILLAQRSVKPGGRIAVVGDDRQAIYGFRGADSDVIDRLKREFSAKELGLTTTYRCPQSVVRLAQRLVPDYQADPSAPMGVVAYPGIDQMIEAIQPDDFLLSRRNAPLAGICLRILKTGKRARLQGKDIGAGLISLVTKWKSRSMPEFLARLQNWREREIVRAESSGSKYSDAHVDAINDKADTLIALSEGLASLGELQNRIRTLFDENDKSPAVMCSSIHKAKGMEANNVFVLASTLNSRMDPPCTCHHWAHKGKDCTKCDCEDYEPDEKKLLEEQNLEYVAITRTKRNLYLVQGEL